MLKVGSDVMDFLKEIKEDTILIVPNILKEKILKFIDSYNSLIKVKIYSFNELKKYIYFDYDYKAILYLMDKYGYKYEIAKNYIENIYYIDHDNYENKKLKFLLRIKQELSEEKLIKSNDFFIKYNFNKNVIVFGYDYINKFNKKILDKFSSVKIIEKKVYDDKKNVYSFSTLEEEILFVIEKIISLNENGISLNNITLVNVNNEYNNEILRLFGFYNIPVDISKSSSILTVPLVKDAINYLKENQSFIKISEYIKEKYDLTSSTNSKIYEKLISIFNKYVDLNYTFATIYDAILYDLSSSIINSNLLEKSVRVSSLIDNYYNDSEYVFLIGCNQGVVPRIYKDEEYISDDIKNEVDVETVSELNKIEKESIINSIISIKNIIITYKLRYMEKEYYKSNLLNSDYFNCNNGFLNNEISYSIKHAQLKLSEMLDDLIKFGNKNVLLKTYFNTLKIPYMEYNNSFSGIDKFILREYLNKKIVLSYTSLDTFYKCQFKYYLDNILKLNKYEETFNTFVGNLFHFVLSRIYCDDFDLEKDYNYYINEKTFSNKEKFFLNKLKKELVIICDRLKQFNNDTGLTKVFTEKNISIDKSSEIEVVFKGIVDKIMYKEFDGKTLVSVVDYKTGSVDIDIYNSIYGLGMQLIIYLYLITKSKIFERYEFVGFYLQKILSSEVNIDKNKSYIEIKNSNLKLNGYSTDEILSLERFDPTYENSEYIASMKYSSKGFSRYAKVLSSDEMSSLVDLVDNKIDAARDSILEADFSINPKKLSSDKEVTGCKFCEYRDICFRKNEDIINLEKYSDLSFLKDGDNNA